MCVNIQTLCQFAVVGAALLQAAGCGPNADDAWRKRTEKQLAEIRTGEADALYEPHPSMLRELARDADIAANLKEVRFIWPNDASSPEYEALADFPNLKHVSLYTTTGADALMQHLVTCDQITILSIDQTDLSDQGLKFISQMIGLEHLGINAWSDRLSTEGLNQLSTLQNLKTLRLSLGPSDRDLNALQAALPGCEITLEIDK